MRHLHPILACLLLFLLALPGCDKHAEDKAAVRTLWEQYNTALDTRDGRTVVASVTARTFPYYQRLMQLALTGTGEEIRRLPVIERSMIMQMRHRTPATDMASLGGDGRGFLRMSVSDGWYQDDEPGWLEIGEIVIEGHLARARLIVNGDKTGHWYYFVREDDAGQPSLTGIWKVDDPEADIFWNTILAKWAADEGLSEDQWLFEVEEFDTGRPVRRDIWDRPASKQPPGGR